MTKGTLETRITELEARNDELETQAEHIADILEIINLQSRYNLWLEMGYYNRIWNELFAQNDPRVRCEIGETGVYEGPESVGRLWKALAASDRPRGYMAMIMPMTPYIVVSKDGKTARGMCSAFGPHSEHCWPYPGDKQKLTAYWFCGKYDNEFLKENGKWKLLSLHTIIYFRSPYDQGWLKQQDCHGWEPPESAPPDKPSVFTELYHPDGVFYPLPAPPEPEE